jgi:hypothetical protein
MWTQRALGPGQRGGALAGVAAVSWTGICRAGICRFPGALAPRGIGVPDAYRLAPGPCAVERLALHALYARLLRGLHRIPCCWLDTPISRVCRGGGRRRLLMSNFCRGRGVRCAHRLSGNPAGNPRLWKVRLKSSSFRNGSSVPTDESSEFGARPSSRQPSVDR